MKSMTGFGRAVEVANGNRIAVTVQSWNHRYLDLVFRLPEELRPLEASLRDRIGTRIQRGRCEIAVRLEQASSDAGSRALDVAALERFLDEAQPLIASSRINESLRLGDLLHSPFLVPSSPDPDRGSALQAGVEKALDAAIEEFDGARSREGDKLSEALAAIWSELREIVRRLAERRAEMGSGLEEALRRRLDEILPEGARPLPPERLAQELALLAERSDVREELERLAAHLEHFDSQRRGTGPHGRRLDFLTQELLRELNTVGSKSRDVETTRLVMEGKVVNEQLREQVQNVE